MTMCRGMIQQDRPIIPKSYTSGEAKVEQCKCGCKKYYEIKTGKEVTVKTGTFEDLLNNFEYKCRIKE